MNPEALIVLKSILLATESRELRIRDEDIYRAMDDDWCVEVSSHPWNRVTVIRLIRCKEQSLITEEK